MLTTTELWLVLIVAALTMIAAIMFIGLSRDVGHSDVTASEEPLSLLFDEGVLHHATNRALKTYALTPGIHIWDDLRRALIKRYPQFPEAIGTSPSGCLTVRPSEAADPSSCEIHWRDGKCWVDVTERSSSEALQNVRVLDNISTLICDAMQQPVWEIQRTGKVGWYNKAFEHLMAESGLTDPDRLFPSSGAEGPGRFPVHRVCGKTDWFDISFFRDGGRTIYSANCVTPLVQAEKTQSTFVQTLAQTFAHLSIGLAIFDNENRLSIFNPALVDLTRLHPSFLAGKPTMHSFFDELRERRGMPEPKNYSTWRQDITDLIAAASGAQYRETWSLEDGRTFSVQGRPHPGGATAFLIEDISTEITLTRNFKIEVGQYAALLDNIEDAIVVFSSTGVLTFCNEGYRQMWGQTPEAAFADVTIQDAINVWKAGTAGDVNWAVFGQFVFSLGQKQSVRVDLMLASGAPIEAVLTPIRSDATMVRFAGATAYDDPLPSPLAATAT